MPPERRALVAALAAGIVMIAALGLVLAFGQLHYPEFPSLEENPDPSIPGTVEFVRWDRDSGCRYSVPAGGGPETIVVCGPDAHGRPLFGHTRTHEGRTLEPTGFDGSARLLASGRGPRTVLLEVEGPRDYGFVDAQWSPDGEWILVSDSAQRLLILPAAGGHARLLVTDASEPRWRR